MTHEKHEAAYRIIVAAFLILSLGIALTAVSSFSGAAVYQPPNVEGTPNVDRFCTTFHITTSNCVGVQLSADKLTYYLGDTLFYQINITANDPRVSNVTYNLVVNQPSGPPIIITPNRTENLVGNTVRIFGQIDLSSPEYATGIYSMQVSVDPNTGINGGQLIDLDPSDNTVVQNFYIISSPESPPNDGPIFPPGSVYTFECTPINCLSVQVETSRSAYLIGTQLDYRITIRTYDPRISHVTYSLEMVPTSGLPEIIASNQDVNIFSSSDFQLPPGAVITGVINLDKPPYYEGAYILKVSIDPEIGINHGSLKETSTAADNVDKKFVTLKEYNSVVPEVPWYFAILVPFAIIAFIGATARKPN